MLWHLSTEYVRVPVEGTEDGDAVDPTDETVDMAFPAWGVDPVDDDWHTAEWEPVPVNGEYFARCLVGPAGGELELAKGRYRPWVRIGGPSPESPIKPARGPLVVT